MAHYRFCPRLGRGYHVPIDLLSGVERSSQSQQLCIDRSEARQRIGGTGTVGGGDEVVVCLLQAIG